MEIELNVLSVTFLPSTPPNPELLGDWRESLLSWWVCPQPASINRRISMALEGGGHTSRGRNTHANSGPRECWALLHKHIQEDERLSMKRQLTWLTWPTLCTLTNELLFFWRHLTLSRYTEIAECWMICLGWLINWVLSLVYVRLY